MKTDVKKLAEFISEIKDDATKCQITLEEMEALYLALIKPESSEGDFK